MSAKNKAKSKGARLRRLLNDNANWERYGKCINGYCCADNTTLIDDINAIGSRWSAAWLGTGNTDQDGYSTEDFSVNLCGR